METAIKRGPGRPPKVQQEQHEQHETRPATLEELSKEELLNLHNAKMEQFAKLMQSCKERETQLQDALKKATLEYNARIEYMLDCVKHAFLSMQFAVNSAKTEA